MTNHVLRGTVAAMLLAGAMTAPAAADGPTAILLGTVDDDRSAVLTARANERLGLTSSAAFRLVIDWRPGESVIALLPVEGDVFLIDVDPASVRSDDFEVIARQPDGSDASMDPGLPRTLEGEVIGHPGSRVAASILEDGLHARIRFADGRDVWIEPIAGKVAGAGPLDHLAYANSAVTRRPGTCATDATMAAPGFGGLAGGAPEGGGSTCAEIACETDDEFIQVLGQAGAQSFIEQVVLMVNQQYESEVGIRHEITAIHLQSGSGDPYGNSPNSSNLLNAFRAAWESAPPTANPYDVAQMFTGRDLAGSTIGVAWLGAVCTSLRYSVIQALFDGSSPNSCVYDLSAHELGHNWGADHCSCTNPSYTMNSFITCANAFSPTQSIPEIIAFRNSRTCIGTCGGGDPVGACCLPSGCAVTTAALCVGQGGTYEGDGTSCAPDPCPAPTGACCLADDTCVETTAANCTGTYQGDGTTCATNPCTVTGDAGVTCITYVTKGGPQQNKHLVVTVTVTDGAGNPAVGVNVSAALSRAEGGAWSFGGTTDSAGEAAFTLLQAADGCYTTDVTALSGVSGDPAEPTNGFQKGVGVTRDEDCVGGTPDNPCP